MKAIKRLAAVALLLAVCAVGYLTGYNAQSGKHYEAACHMSDLIRCYQDHLNDGYIEDYGCFEELEGNFLYDSDHPVDLREYVWCY